MPTVKPKRGRDARKCLPVRLVSHAEHGAPGFRLHSILPENDSFFPLCERRTGGLQEAYRKAFVGRLVYVMHHNQLTVRCYKIKIGSSAFVPSAPSFHREYQHKERLLKDAQNKHTRPQTTTEKKTNEHIINEQRRSDAGFAIALVHVARIE